MNGFTIFLDTWLQIASHWGYQTSEGFRFLEDFKEGILLLIDES